MAKDALLLELSRHFNEYFSRARQELAGPADELKDNVEKVEQLQSLYDLVSAFPVWPYDVGTLRRFVVTMVSPVLGILLPLLFENLVAFLLPVK